MLNHETLLKLPLKFPKPVTRPGTALDGQKDIALGRRGRCRGTDLSPSSSHEDAVLWPHTEQELCFFDLSPLHLGLKTMYSPGSRVAGGSTAFEDPSTWPPSKVLLLFIASWCYCWYLMIFFWHYSCMSDICPEPEPDCMRCCRTPWENKCSTCPQSSQPKYSSALQPFAFIQSLAFILLDSTCKFRCKDWVFLWKLKYYHWWPGMISLVLQGCCLQCAVELNHVHPQQSRIPEINGCSYLGRVRLRIRQFREFQTPDIGGDSREFRMLLLPKGHE